MTRGFSWTRRAFVRPLILLNRLHWRAHSLVVEVTVVRRLGRKADYIWMGQTSAAMFAFRICRLGNEARAVPGLPLRASWRPNPLVLSTWKMTRFTTNYSHAVPQPIGREKKSKDVGREVRPTWQNWSHSKLQRTFSWELIVKDWLIFWSSISSNRSHAKTWKSRYHSAACRLSVFIVNTIYLMRQFDLITISINMQYCYWSTSSCKSTRGVV